MTDTAALDTAEKPPPLIAVLLAESRPPRAVPYASGPHHSGTPADEAARVRIGSSPQTDPRVLLSLASDPSVTVRAAVALNRATPAQVDLILASDSDERVRTLLARKLANLIPELSDTQRDSIQNQALDTLSRLVEDEAERVRVAIADAVKDMPSAPHELILRLARDSAVSVSDPVIRLSPLLTTEDLLGLLGTGVATTAIAVARRPYLAEIVSDAIAARDDTQAITALLSNRSAGIREATLDALVARAGEVTAWHAPLVQRPKLTARAARALSDIVATQLLDTLASRADLPRAISQELRSRLAQRLKPGIDARPEPNIEQAMAQAQILYAEGRLNEQCLLDTIQRGEARLSTAMIAVATDLPATVVDRAATLRSAKGLVSLIWRAGFSMRAAGPLQTLLARLPPESVLRGTASGGFPLAIEEMRWQIDFLARMGR